MQRDESSEAVEAFRSYARAFQSLDARGVAEHFAEPALLISPQGVVALPTRAAVADEYGRLLAGLPAQGYARTEFSPLAGRRLSDDLALVTGAGTWKTTSGEELQRFGLTYTLRRTGQTWQIVVAAIHDPGA